ncbi:MAG: hypothetical protein WDN25_16595 [Acetobacteraceae bacterium]
MNPAKKLVRFAGMAMVLALLAGCAYDQGPYGAAYATNYPYYDGYDDGFFGPDVIIGGGLGGHFHHHGFHASGNRFAHGFNGGLAHGGFPHGGFAHGGFAHGGFGGHGRG